MIGKRCFLFLTIEEKRALQKEIILSEKDGIASRVSQTYSLAACQKPYVYCKTEREDENLLTLPSQQLQEHKIVLTFVLFSNVHYTLY